MLIDLTPFKMVAFNSLVVKMSTVQNPSLAFSFVTLGKSLYFELQMD
jgi:hypothetical protein